MPTTGDAVGPYTLIKKLGSGAFGTVWLAERRTAIITTKVAIKLPLIENIDLDAVKKEAELWAMISGHPNILPIIEANIYNNQVVIVSEYVAGGTLDQFLRIYDGRMLDTKRAVEIVAGILSGLEYLHSKKIIHRDLKPANILMQEGIPRIADFGISRLMKTSTHSNRSSGTPSYMSPEAFTGMRSHQTDIWSVGVILYQMLSGRLPFPGENPMEIMFSITMREPQALPNTVPIALQKIVERALQKDINQRYKNSLDMRNDLWNTVVNGSKLAVPEFNLDKVLNQNQITSTNVSLRQISLSLDDSIPPPPIDTLKNRIIIKKGDIMLEKVDAIVNPTDRIFSGRIGIDNRVHIMAGPKLREECDKLGTCPPGEARITRGHKLTAAWVIHTCGPTWKDINSAEIDILANCYKNCFELARQQNIKTIAMPPIRTEAIGFPLEKAAAVAIKEIKTFLEADQTISRVILVGFTTKEYNCFITAMEDAFK